MPVVGLAVLKLHGVVADMNRLEHRELGLQVVLAGGEEQVVLVDGLPRVGEAHRPGQHVDVVLAPLGMVAHFYLSSPLAERPFGQRLVLALGASALVLVGGQFLNRILVSRNPEKVLERIHEQLARA